jgi:hypothetical protein
MVNGAVDQVHYFRFTGALLDKVDDGVTFLRLGPELDPALKQRLLVHDSDASL